MNPALEANRRVALLGAAFRRRGGSWFSLIELAVGA
jgi:hypothetical protein